MKIALVNPPQVNGKNFIREECCSGPYTLVMPAQVTTAAAFLRNEGLDIDVIDAQVMSLGGLQGYDAVVAWVSIFGIYDDVKILEKAKENNAKTIMILNDPFEGIEKEAMEKFAFIDFTVRLNERELTLLKLLRTIEKQEKINFPGIIYREKGKVVDTGLSPAAQDLHHLVSAKKVFEELPLEKYTEGLLLAGKGCPFGCTYCAYRHTMHRGRRPQDVAEELSVVATAQNYAYVIDLDMLYDKKFCHALSDNIIKNNIKINWKTDGRVEQVDNETIAKMGGAGLSHMILGVESLDSQIIEQINKGIKLEWVFRAQEILQKNDVIPQFEAMFGFPYDNKKSAQSALDFISKLKAPTYVSLSILRPLRGTPIYAECLKKGLISELHLDDYYRSLEKRLINKTLHLNEDEFNACIAKINYEAMKLDLKTDMKWHSRMMQKNIGKPKHFAKHSKEALKYSYAFLKNYGYRLAHDKDIKYWKEKVS